MSNGIKSTLLFICLLVLTICIFTFFPIRIFSAEVISNSYSAVTDISIGDWLGFTEESQGYNFKLLGKGYFLLILIILGLPTLLTYSFWIKNKMKDNEH